MIKFRANRKWFDSEKLLLDKKWDRGTFKRLVVKCLGIVITRHKDSNKLQVPSTTMDKGVGKVAKRNVRE